VRTILATAIILATVAVSYAQEQEKKLLDRLLKPDTTLQNSAQGKEFTAEGTISTKKAATKSFYVTSRSPEKRYTNVQTTNVKEFPTRDAQIGDRKANTASRTMLVGTEDPYPTAAYATRGSPDSTKLVEVSDYTGVRPFLVRGKSQKSLSAPRRPMTIDEVRELLNKNK
jgi:hypothetical protein